MDELHDDSVRFVEMLKQDPASRAQMISAPDMAHGFDQLAADKESIKMRDHVYDSGVAMIRASWDERAKL